MGRGPLDHLPDIGEIALEASVSSPVLLGGGEDASGPATTYPEAKADMLKARTHCQPGGLNGRGGAGGGGGDATAPVEDRGGAGVRREPAGTSGHRGRAIAAAITITEEGHGAKAVASPLEVSVFSADRKCKAEVPALALRKSLKVSMGSTAQQVVEAQAAVQCGGASARADLEELVAQGEATGAATERAGEEMPTPREAEARESDGAEAPLVAEATEGEIEPPRTSEAEATKAGHPRPPRPKWQGPEPPKITEAGVVGTGAPETTEVGVAGAGASAAKPAAQEVEAEVGQALIPSPVQELEKEASSAAEASWVEVQGWKEKGEDSLVEAQRWKEKAKASRVAAQRREEKAEELEKEVTRVAEASAPVQAVLEAKIGEHNALQSAAPCPAVISSHYAGIDLEAVNDDYVLPKDDEEANEEVAKLMEAAEGPGMALAKLFEEEVVPPPPSTDAGDPEP
ncbi:uncharacterized protein [Miscanthus floridulus]|uniref:uncharacterized protein n=1 Tax=Miscanthus floridulus TaxID=154761 RepID=UPI003458D0B1